jgi:GT2 family glycosyltransferase
VLAQRELPIEIIVLDDGDLSEDFLSEWRNRIEARGIGLIYIRKQADLRGLPFSRNMGWRMAKGDIVQFMDDDSELHPECLFRVNEVFTADTGGVLSGIDFPILEQARLGRGRKIIDFAYKMAGWWDIGHRFYPEKQFPVLLSDLVYLQPARYLQGSSMAIRRDRLEQAGGFDETLGRYSCGEDKDISIRLAKEGLLARVRDIGVKHFSDPAGRIEPKELGIETAFNYLYINRKQGPFGMGEWMMIGYNLIVLMMIEAVFAVKGDRRRHLATIAGLLAGIQKYLGTLWRS